MRWFGEDIVEAVEAGLMARAREDDLAQAVYGFDALSELGLHPLIRASLAKPGYGVWPETPYPGDWAKAKKTDAKRCDLVLTADGLPIRDPAIKNTLFDSLPAADADEAYWLEIKTVAQFEKGGAFSRYSAELLSPVTADVRKLWEDPVIRHAGLLLVLFTVSQEVADHDVMAWHERCMKRGLPVQSPVLRGFGLNDRIGNGYCAIALFGVRG
jgi:hypothetical protein